MPCDIASFRHRVAPGSWVACWMTISKLLCRCCIVWVLQNVLQCAFGNFFSVSSFARNMGFTLIFEIVFFQVWTKVFKVWTARLSGLLLTLSRHGLDWYKSTSPVLSMSWPGSISCDTDYLYLLWHRLPLVLSLVTPTTSCSISCSISCDTDTCGHTPWMSWSTCLPPTVVCGRLSRAPEATHRDPPVSFPPESELRLKPGVPAAGVHSNGQGLARFLPKVFALKGLSSHGAHRQEPYTLSSESVLPNLCLG